MHSFITVAYIHIHQNKVLLVKPRKHNVFYMPGGKQEAGEDEIATLIREVKEELDVDLLPDSIERYGEFEDQAYAKPEGTNVKIVCYVGKHEDEPAPANEIEEIRYFEHAEYLNMPEVAPAVKLIVDDLKKRNLIA